MKMKILIVAPYTTFPPEGLPNRFSTLANKLHSRGHIVELVTSDFIHHSKDKRFHKNVREEKYSVTLISTPIYNRNFSLARFFSIYKFTKNFKDTFRSFEKYDVVYASYPMVGTCYHIAKSIAKPRLIVDIQDLWPEAIWKNFSLFKWAKFVFYPIQRMKRVIFARADFVISVSRTYLESYKEAIKTDRNYVCYLGSDLSFQKTKEAKWPIRLFYFGTISHSYDIETICQAICILREKTIDYEFHIFGDGPERIKIERKNYEGTHFHGFVPYNKLENHLSKMDAAVNAIKSGAAQSITNKLSDYLSIGSPILNSQQSSEIDEILSNHKTVSYKAGDVADLVDRLSSVSNQKILLSGWMSDRRFNREEQIAQICTIIEKQGSGV